MINLDLYVLYIAWEFYRCVCVCVLRTSSVVVVNLSDLYWVVYCLQSETDVDCSLLYTVCTSPSLSLFTEGHTKRRKLC
jgi:hypothetical protein